MVKAGSFDLALVLSGGNALGAYQAGAYEAMHKVGWLPDWVAGGSAGAINGALICGNEASRRIERLRALWRPSAAALPDFDLGGLFEDVRRTAAATMTLVAGRPGIFVPKHLSWLLGGFATPEPGSLYDTLPMRGELERLADFTLLNGASAPRLSATAIDIESGEDVVFDSRAHPLTVDHLRASAALLPLFPPVEIDGRTFGDAGISANLPLDCVLSQPGEGPLLCLAIDLLPLHGVRPAGLSGSALRMQDLIFATQSRRAIAAWQAIFDERARRGEGRPTTLVHLSYSSQEREVSGKAFDFSPRSAAGRWSAGLEDVSRAIESFAAGDIEVRREPGLSVYARPSRSADLRLTRFPLAPHPV